MGFNRSLSRAGAVRRQCQRSCSGGTNTSGPLRLPKETFDRALALTPIGHMCEPEDIANAVAFLASSDACFITGQTLVINGSRGFY